MMSHEAGKQTPHPPLKSREKERKQGQREDVSDMCRGDAAHSSTKLAQDQNSTVLRRRRRSRHPFSFEVSLPSQGSCLIKWLPANQRHRLPGSAAKKIKESVRTSPVPNKYSSHTRRPWGLQLPLSIARSRRYKKAMITTAAVQGTPPVIYHTARNALGIADKPLQLVSVLQLRRRYQYQAYPKPNEEINRFSLSCCTFFSTISLAFP